jgi:hypothetical protein
MLAGRNDEKDIPVKTGGALFANCGLQMEYVAQQAQ